MSFDLTHKVASVTGGARDIGRADSVLSYQSSEAPARETAEAIQALGRRVITVPADVTKKAEIERLVAQARDFGKGVSISWSKTRAVWSNEPSSASSTERCSTK